MMTWFCLSSLARKTQTSVDVHRDYSYVQLLFDSNFEYHYPASKSFFVWKKDQWVDIWFKPWTKNCELFGKMSNLLFDCLNGNVWSNVVNYFELMKDSNTKQHYKLIRLPAIRFESSRKIFYFNVAKSFNDLPNKIRKVESRCQFLLKLNEYI